MPTRKVVCISFGVGYCLLLEEGQSRNSWKQECLTMVIFNSTHAFNLKKDKDMAVKVDFNHVYQEYYNKAFRFANLYVRNDLAAEDLATEAMLKLWETMQKEPVEKTASLLLTILKNKSLDYLKVQARAREAVETMESWRQRELAIRISTLEACDPEKILSDEIQSILRDTLNKLPEQTRKVFIMSRFEQKSGKEIRNAFSAFAI